MGIDARMMLDRRVRRGSTLSVPARSLAVDNGFAAALR
jgi:hypothetical protein